MTTITPNQLCQILKLVGLGFLFIGFLLIFIGVFSASRAEIPLKNWLKAKPKPKPPALPVIRYAIIPDPRTQELERMLWQETDTDEWDVSQEGVWYLGKGDNSADQVPM